MAGVVTFSQKCTSVRHRYRNMRNRLTLAPIGLVWAIDYDARVSTFWQFFVLSLTSIDFSQSLVPLVQRHTCSSIGHTLIVQTNTQHRKGETDRNVKVEQEQARRLVYPSRSPHRSWMNSHIIVRKAHSTDATISQPQLSCGESSQH